MSPRRIYQVLLWVFPSGFRERFGLDMEHVFEARLLAARTRPARVGVWLHAFTDIVVHGLAERRAYGRRRASNWSGFVDSILQDIRQGIRALRRTPGFALVALTTLALGMGATTAVFSVVNAVILRPLPYPSPDRLVAVWPAANFNKSMVGLVAAGVPALESVSGISIWTMTLTGDGGEPVEVEVALVSPNHFDVLGVKAALGRTFVADDAERGRAGVVVLSHEFWKNRYGGDPAVLGKAIRLAGAEYNERTVIGVMPEGFRPVRGRGPDLAGWVLLEEPEATTFVNDNSWFVNWRVGRLAVGATSEQATEQIRAVAASLHVEAPTLITDDDVRLASVVPLHESLVGSMGRTLWLLLGAVGLVLLIACVNVANLLLARGEHRLRELALRRALGARGGRLVRQLLTEATVLGIGGGVAGVVLALGLLRLMAMGAPAELAEATSVGLSAGVLLFAFVMSMIASIVFGTVPAWRARGAEAADALRQWTRSAAGTRLRPGVSSALVTIELALAVMLVVGSGLMLRTLQRLYDVDPGFDANGVLVLRPAPPEWRYEDAVAMTRYYNTALESIRAMPNVAAAAGIQLLPVTDGNWRFPTYPEGFDVPKGNAPPSINFRVVTPGWFETLRIPLLRGRTFAMSDDREAPRVAVVNRAMADRFWPDQDPIGKTVRNFSSDGRAYTVVGIVGDVRQRALSEAPFPEMYVTQEQLWFETSLFLAVRLRDVRNVERYGAAVRDAVWNVDRDVPISGIEALTTVVGRSATTTRFLTVLLVCFGALALSLGAIGVYGVTSWAVARRTPEFGVRLALGATEGHVLASAARRGFTPIAIGLGLGLISSFLASRVIASLLFEVSATDPITLVAVTVLLVLVAAAALFIPAWRATRVDPIAALRAD